MRRAVDEAVRIGRMLVDEAFVVDGRATWLARAVRVQDGGAAWPSTDARIESLGSRLADGTPGVAVFLAYLASLEGERDAARLAHAALDHAFAALASVPRRAWPGFHEGAGGLAWALHEVGTLLDEPRHRRRADTLLEALGSTPQAKTIGLARGEGGTLMALLHSRKARPEVIARRARRLAARTIEPDPPSGVSAGRAGGCVALDAAWAAGVVESRTAAGWHLEKGRIGSLSPWWCQGAAGVGAGLAASPDRARFDSEIAQCRGIVEASRSDLVELPGWDAQICHGLLGLAVASDALGTPGVLSATVGRLIERHAGADRPAWPTASFTAPHPSLFHGLAGIGLTLLHARGRAPSPLTLGWRASPWEASRSPRASGTTSRRVSPPRGGGRKASRPKRAGRLG